MSGLRSGAWTGKAIFYFVCAGLLIIIIAGLTTSHPRPENFMNFRELGNGTVTLSSFYTAMLAAFWAYQGWVSVGFIGGEITNARRNIPKGIAIGVVVVIAVYILVKPRIHAH
jgi:APA family basic amino acid/polyamine antiporter